MSSIPLSILCDSQAHCTACRDLDGGRAWRISLLEHIEGVEAPEGHSRGDAAVYADFACPRGRQWGEITPPPDYTAVVHGSATVGGAMPTHTIDQMQVEIGPFRTPYPASAFDALSSDERAEIVQASQDVGTPEQLAQVALSMKNGGRERWNHRQYICLECHEGVMGTGGAFCKIKYPRGTGCKCNWKLHVADPASTCPIAKW